MENNDVGQGSLFQRSVIFSEMLCFPPGILWQPWICTSSLGKAIPNWGVDGDNRNIKKRLCLHNSFIAFVRTGCYIPAYIKNWDREECYI